MPPSSYDAVTMGGKMVGVSMFWRLQLQRALALSLGWESSTRRSTIGDVLTLVWGEENGGTKKPTVERHKQLEVRVKVSPVPYARGRARGLRAGLAHPSVLGAVRQALARTIFTLSGYRCSFDFL